MLPTEAVVAVTFAVTFIVSVTVTAIITFVVTCVCVKRILESTDIISNSNDLSPQEKMLYEHVDPPSNPITKNDLELQPNPAYGTNHKVTMDTNPAYESY